MNQIIVFLQIQAILRNVKAKKTRTSRQHKAEKARENRKSQHRLSFDFGQVFFRLNPVYNL